MKTIIFLCALLCVSWTFPQGPKELKFKRLYVDPLVPVTGNSFPRIVNGQEVVPHSIPSQAYLIVTGAIGNRWLCGGSLISRKFVLTAGHCVDGGQSAEVWLGAHNVQQTEATQQRLSSHTLILHPDFNLFTISYDIGLIQLDEEVELNENIQTIELPRRSEVNNSYVGDSARVSGWGLTDGFGSTSPVLRQVNSTVITNEECDSVFGIVENYQVCISGVGGVGACNGDSGGPLVRGNKQIGIVSYGISYCFPGYPSAFTRTSSFLDWISANSDVEIV